MPKMKRIGAVGLKRVDAALGGRDPVVELVKLLSDELDVKALEVPMGELLAGWYRDYEPTADGERLRLRGGIRVTALLKLAEFVYAKQKSVEGVEEEKALVSEVRQYREGEVDQESKCGVLSEKVGGNGFGNQSAANGALVEFRGYG